MACLPARVASIQGGPVAIALEEENKSHFETFETLRSFPTAVYLLRDKREKFRWIFVKVFLCNSPVKIWQENSSVLNRRSGKNWSKITITLMKRIYVLLDFNR